MLVQSQFSNYTATASLCESRFSSIDMMSSSFESPSHNEFIQKSTEVIRSVFQRIDRCLSLPIPGASAEPITFTASSVGVSTTGTQTQSVEKKDDEEAFIGGLSGFEKFEHRQRESAVAMQSLIDICQSDTELCHQDSPERKLAMEKLTSLLEVALPKSGSAQHVRLANAKRG